MKFKALFGIFIVVAGVYFGYMLLPPYFGNYQLQDDLTSIARFSSAAPQDRPDDDIKAEVLKKAKEHDVPITSDNIKISRDGRQVLIAVEYSVTLNFVGGKDYTIQFADVSDAKAKELVSNQKDK